MKKYQIILAGLVASAQVYASTTTLTNPNTGSSAQSVAPSIVNKLTASAATTLYGNNFESRQDQGLLSENTLNLGYKVSNNLIIGPSAKFYWSNKSEGLYFNETYLKVVVPNVYTKGNFTLANQNRIYAPISNKAQNANFNAAVRSYLIPEMKLGHSKFSISALSFVHKIIPNAHAKDGAIDFYALTDPTLNYYSSDALKLYTTVELVASHARGNGNMSLDAGQPGYESNIQSGIAYTVGRVEINPYIQFTRYGKATPFQWSGISGNLSLSAGIL